MSSAIQILPHYTFEDRQRWEGQWELIHGIPHAMSPAPLPKHQRVANALAGEFHVALKRRKDCKAFQPVDYKVADDIIVRPDLLVICRKIEKTYLDFPPSLVAEIISPATVLKDRHTKFQIYQSQQIKYYLIFSPDAEETEVYEYRESEYKLMQKGKDFSYAFDFDEDCSVSIGFAEIWK